MREVLYDEQGLEVAVSVREEDGQARLELGSQPEGPDLSVSDEVVVVVNGKGRVVQVDGPRRASAVIAESLGDDPDEMTLMVRVHEFFEGWELWSSDEN